MNAHAKVETEITLGSLAREALVSHSGRTPDAVDAILARITNDANLLRRLIRSAVEDAIKYRVEMAMRNDRQSIIRATTGTRGAVVALANGLSRALLDMPLANGLPLREATRAQVLAQAEGYNKTAMDATHKAKWLQAIAQSVPDGKRVGDVMDDERAAELYRETV